MAVAPKSRRTQRVQIYLDPNVEQEKLLLDIWRASQMLDKPQDLFRNILRAGVKSLLETGDMPQSVIAATKLTQRVRIAPPMINVAPHAYYPQPAENSTPVTLPPTAAPPTPLQVPAENKAATIAERASPTSTATDKPSEPGRMPSLDDLVGLMGRGTKETV